MNRTQLASYTLMASAFVLAAMVCLQASRHIENEAHAEMVLTGTSITMLSTQIARDAEALYVLDANQSRLLVYAHDPNKRMIDLIGAMDVSDMFAKAAGGGAAGNTNNNRRRGR